jgi:hypothetical protein
MLIFGSKGNPLVRELQNALITLGHDLPKYGADGQLGHETIDSLQEWIDDYGGQAGNGIDQDDNVDESLARFVIGKAVLLKRASTQVAAGVDWHDISDAHPGKANRGIRPWRNIDAIVLHQTGIFMNNTLNRWKGLRAHIGILSLPRPTVVQVYPLNVYLHHANEVNNRSIGFEFNGCFEGIDGDIKTAWRGGYKANPDVCTQQQIDAGRAAIQKVCAEVKLRGGEIKYCYGHRQFNDKRRNDPGSLVWQQVGMWAIKALGLSDGGPGFQGAKSGRPIPREWDGSRTEDY